MHACSGRGAGIQTGKNYKQMARKMEKMRQTRKIFTKLGKVVISSRNSVYRGKFRVHPLHIPVDSTKKEKTKRRGREGAVLAMQLKFQCDLFYVHSTIQLYNTPYRLCPVTQ
jgi:hypothetical protein